jgi:hypothetical protein
VSRGIQIHRAMTSFPPRHLCIAGALFIAYGAGSVVKTLSNLIEGRFSVEIGFVLIPIGYGILIGRASSRKWALFFTIAGLVGAVIGGALMLHGHWTGSERLPYPDSVSTLFDLVLSWAFCLYVSITLTRSGHREWFAAEKEDRTAAKSVTWAVAVVALVLFSSQHVAAWRNREMYEKPRPFRVRVTPYNAVDGKGLTAFGFKSDTISPKPDSKTKLPKVEVTYLNGKDGPQFEFHGVAAQPFEVTIHADGFADKPLTLTGKSEFDIRLPMQPLDADAPKQDTGVKPAAR